MTTLITVMTFSGGNRYVDSSSFARDLCRFAVLPDYGSQELTAYDGEGYNQKKRSGSIWTASFAVYSAFAVDSSSGFLTAVPSLFLNTTNLSNRNSVTIFVTIVIPSTM